MSTTHEEELSYLTFGELWLVILAKQNWPLFSDYLPPLENVLARIEEIKTIRNRVAHCRLPHQNDLRRLDLFLRDVDPGLRRFCVRYNLASGAMSSDMVATGVSSLWTSLGYSTELFSTDLGWLYAPGSERARPRLGARLSRHCPSESVRSAGEGTIYRLDVFGIGGQNLGLLEVLEQSLRWREHLIHIIVESSTHLAVTLPAAVGVPKIVEIIGAVLDAARNSLHTVPDENLAALVKRGWPECVLWPNHPLAIFVEEYDGMILDLE